MAELGLYHFPTQMQVARRLSKRSSLPEGCQILFSPMLRSIHDLINEFSWKETFTKVWKRNSFTMIYCSSLKSATLQKEIDEILERLLLWPTDTKF